MNTVVLCKEVPDTEARLTVKNGKVDFEGYGMVINPFDEYALEEALRIKDKYPETYVYVIMVGKATATKNLLNCLALGADEALLIADDALEGSDPPTIARIIAKAIQNLNPEIIFAGKQGVDYDWGLTPIALAELLGFPHVGVVKRFEPDLQARTFKAVMETDEGDLYFEGKLPAVITAEKGLNEPRYASLKGIMSAKKKPLAVKSLGDIGFDASEAGAGKSKITEVSLSLPPEKKPGRIIEGEKVEDKVAELVRALVEEAKVL